MVILFALVVIATIASAVIYHAAWIAAFWASLFFLTHLGLLTWIVAHPWQTLLRVSLYFLIGAGWSVAKWWFAETNRARKAKATWAANTFVGEDGCTTPRETWEKFSTRNKTLVRHYREEMIAWIAFWPINLPWTLLNDPVRRLCRRIYLELTKVYQRITDHVWK